MQYEFRGKNLQDALSKATTQRNNCKADAGERHTCQKLARWIDQLAGEVDVLKNEISDLERHLANLEQSRSDSITDAAIGAATIAAGALGSAARTARTIHRVLKGGRVHWNDVLSAIPYVGGAILTARSALAVARDSREISAAINRLNGIERMLQAIQGTARDLQRTWQENGCDRYF